MNDSQRKRENMEVALRSKEYTNSLALTNELRRILVSIVKGGHGGFVMRESQVS